MNRYARDSARSVRVVGWRWQSARRPKPGGITHARRPAACVKVLWFPQKFARKFAAMHEGVRLSRFDVGRMRVWCTGVCVWRTAMRDVDALGRRFGPASNARVTVVDAFCGMIVLRGRSRNAGNGASCVGRRSVGLGVKRMARNDEWFDGLTYREIDAAISSKTAPGSDVPGGVVVVPRGYASTRAMSAQPWYAGLTYGQLDKQIANGLAPNAIGAGMAVDHHLDAVTVPLGYIVQLRRFQEHQVVFGRSDGAPTRTKMSAQDRHGAGLDVNGPARFQAAAMALQSLLMCESPELDANERARFVDTAVDMADRLIVRLSRICTGTEEPDR